MKAIVLAAGEGTRMRPLTFTTPKPLLKITDKSILAHNLEQLSKVGISEAILVVGYLKEKIKQEFGNRYGSMSIVYVEQKEQLGTGDALMQAESFVDDRFLVIHGDDLHFAEDMKKCLNHETAVAAKEVINPQDFGIFVSDNGFVKDLIEKPRNPPSNLANAAIYILNKSIFDFLKRVKKSERNEIELTDAIKEMSENEKLHLEIVENWTPLVYPWELLKAMEMMMINLKRNIHSTASVEANATINGEVVIGKNSKIKNGVYIEGPVIIGDNSDIGPNCYIRQNTVIGNNCKIGNAVEIKNSIINDNTKIEHLSYIGDSIIENNCNIGAGTIIANLRHDNKNVKFNVKGEVVDTGRRKFGAVIASYSKTGIHTSIYPGVHLGPFSWTVPSVAVKENIKPFHIYDGKLKQIEAKKIDEVIKSDEDKKILINLFEHLKKEE